MLILYFSASVIALYTAIQALWLSRLGPNRHIYRAYAALSVIITVFLVSTSVFTIAPTLAVATLTTKLQGAAAFAYLIALNWLLARYANIPWRGAARRFLLTFSVTAGALGLYSLFLPAGFFAARLWPMEPGGLITFGFDYRPASVIFQVFGLIGVGWCIYCIRALRRKQPLAALLFSSFIALQIITHVSQSLHYFFGLTAIPVLPGGMTYIWFFVITAILFARDHEDTVLELVAKNQSLTREVSSRNAAERRARLLALSDELTKLSNIRNLKKTLEWFPKEIPNARLLLLQIDYFRELKKTFGEAKTDQLLLQLAERLSSGNSDSELAARISEAQFAILTSEPERYLYTAGKSHSPTSALTRPFTVGQQTLDLTYSIALVGLGNESSVSDMLYHAELALEEAITNGGNQVIHYDGEFAEKIQHRFSLERELDRAIEDNQLALHYQPQVDSTGHLIGAEALLRWRHPDHGWISPNTFIPLIERRGQMVSFGQWVLEQACRDLKAWQQRGSFNGRLSVNVSPYQLQAYNYGQKVLDTLKAYDVPPSSIGLELTESGMVEEASSSLAGLPLLRRAGVTIAIDDFGTGFSSLSYLGRLPIDTLKIDKAFVDQLGTRKGDALLKALMNIGQSLDLKVLAEGIERENQHRALQEMGCRYFQGYLFGKPVSADQFVLEQPKAVSVGASDF
ncbi:diguanylate cyclase (GGDEF)-like protein [Litorivivens lipolytica]|uniref:Diguanylate cyclase (GGDEF)-like protein n=1 Tax=Litorivivens lipolytica TaxID=1524264 RepID=A0A7W4W6S1_9GAMM|nr:GGDEF domain-containing phosphodiesterase [Litorivivens lipolytica]MBB3048460.1 diguanylate cyclase (GGDEF)-like protein [Litorivivens lipolytica]